MKLAERDRMRLTHMLKHSSEAMDYIAAKQRTDLDEDRLLQLALVRLLEVIGEAAARVSGSCQQAHPAIPWPEIIGLRNRLIHGYDSVDLDILWNILQDDVPQLVEELQGIVRD